MLANRVRIGSREVVKWGLYQNVALGGIATASTTLATNIPDKAIDGNKTSPTSKWISATQDQNPYWQVDLLQVCKIDKIRIYTDSVFGHYPVSSYRVEYWNGSNWVQFIDVTGDTSELKTHEFTPLKTSKLKLSFPGVKWSQRIFEFEAYGERKG